MTNLSVSRENGLDDMQCFIESYHSNPLGAFCRIFQEVLKNGLIPIGYGDVFGFGRHFVGPVSNSLRSFRSATHSGALGAGQE